MVSWKRLNTHVYKVSFPCVLPLASLRSEEVILKKIARGYFLLVIVMETIEYTCAPSFTSMCAILSKLHEGRGKFEENCLRLFVVVYKHVI